MSGLHTLCCLLPVMFIRFGACEGRSLGERSGLDEAMLVQAEEQKLDEEDGLSFLGFMKEGFLRKLNLSSVPQEHRKVQPPQFMMELYNKYASDKNSKPRSNVIRSFLVQDKISSIRFSNKTQHRLLFNISIPKHEVITSVQLRIFTLWAKRTKVICNGFFTSINVYDVGVEQNLLISSLLDRRVLSEGMNSWEAFDVTRAVRNWHDSGRGAGELQVEIQQNCDSLDISLSLEDNSSAVVVVFSDDLGDQKPVKKQLLYEKEQMFLNNQLPLTGHRRRRRKAGNNYCQRTSLKVNFKDIGWDKWIVAPPEYDAYECRGVCYFPLTDNVNPSRHAVIQTLVNLSNPKKANKACCVPTKLDPIAVMYQEKGVITVRHLYEEMKVVKCGCR
ncbi:hypothetical protein DNTS_024417 [Danionella cerebrum]|uniref:TGF-beta family profile domain-containing protein n=1 Tax=Danionella cerebrum TaxID=2873325 RepID=A0A553RL27_9TELE|nr:hypothetical protein DNTS_024417 [Danionella translucida]